MCPSAVHVTAAVVRYDKPAPPAWLVAAQGEVDRAYDGVCTGWLARMSVGKKAADTVQIYLRENLGCGRPAQSYARTTCTILRHDGPNHLGLRGNALPEHQMALLTSGCVPSIGSSSRLPQSGRCCRPRPSWSVQALASPRSEASSRTGTLRATAGLTSCTSAAGECPHAAAARFGGRVIISPHSEVIRAIV